MPDKKNNTSAKGHVISHFKAPTPTILTENDFHLFKYQILHPISHDLFGEILFFFVFFRHTAPVLRVIKMTLGNLDI